MTVEYLLCQSGHYCNYIVPNGTMWYINLMSWLIYHNIEEALIACACFIIALRFYFFYRDKDSLTTKDKGRLYFVVAGFFILGISSAFHAAVHVLDLPYNLLFQTILGYAFGFLMLIFAITMQNPEKKKYLILFYLPLLIFLSPMFINLFLILKCSDQ